MLERIEEIQGIGLLHDLNGKKYALSKTTLIYSDNGRGKSTLASVMRSLSSGDVRSIAERRTIDGALEPKVVWQFASGHKVKFETGTWSEQRPEIMVFDVDFIGRNVHSGGIVKTDQRKSLLEFALGSAAVAARKLEEDASIEAANAMEIVNQLTKQLAGYHQGIILSDFEKMETVKDADIQIEELQKRILAANNITSLLSKPVPSIVQLPGIDLTALFKILGKSIEDIQEDAERLVHSHIALIDKDGTESWLNSGQHFDNGTTCPYCGQGTAGVTLIRAYRTYFNAAYADLKKQVAVLERGIAVRIGEGIVETFASSVKAEQAISSAWSAHIKDPAIMFDSIGATLRLTELREFLLELVEKKQANPTVSIGTQDEKEKAEDLWNHMINDMSECNRQISTAKSIIDQFRISLGK
ncbi:AAA family ATPase [Undibacterium sp. Tian12W]|uniref:AAA family ATPase n=1 Tax=Undibacterium sp. Tian12W TaxID=3413054 RepID=UPI003BF0D38B